MGDGTRAVVGKLRSNRTFDASERAIKSEQGLGSCGQSLTDAQGRRVQFGWQHLSLPGASGLRGGALEPSSRQRVECACVCVRVRARAQPSED